MPSLRRVLRTAQPFVILLAFVLLGLLLRSQWAELRTYEWKIRPAWLAVSATCLLGGWLIEIRMWQRLLALVGGRLPYWSAVRIWFASGIVRYIPGNVWQPLSLAMRGRERGVRPEVMLASLSLFQAIHVMAVGPIAAVYMALWKRTGAGPYWIGSFSPWWSILAVLPAAVLLIRPGAMLSIGNVILTKLGREPLPVRFSTGQLLGLFGISLGAWMFFCAGFAALAASILSGRVSVLEAAPHLAAAYPIAFAIGFLSLLTPSGLVVREGALFVLLAPVIGKGDALVVALAMRVWEISLDAFVSLCALGAPWLRRSSAIR